MKAILFATAAVFVTVAGAHAGEEYPTPVSRPIVSSVPVHDVSGGGAWSAQTVVTGNGGYVASTGGESMPTYQAPAAARPALAQHGVAGATHG